MVDIGKIINGGMYLVDLKGNVNPEFGYLHYCILIKTHDKDLFLAFPTTTSKDRQSEDFTYVLPVDNSIILFKHTRIVSKFRVIDELKDNDGHLIVLSDEELDCIFKEYEKFIKHIEGVAKKSVKQYFVAKEAAKDALKLKCIEEITLKRRTVIDYNSLITEASSGKIVHNLISTKKIGTQNITYTLTDKFGHKTAMTVKVNIIEPEEK